MTQPCGSHILIFPLIIFKRGSCCFSPELFVFSFSRIRISEMRSTDFESDSLPRSLKEFTPEYTQTDKWKELSFNAGGVPSTLQDIKVIPHSGGHAFTKQKNRFLYWRSNYDVLEMIEQSLDVNLYGNQVKLHFHGAPVLNGISVYEADNCVVILIATAGSIHRLSFPQKKREVGYSSSIFADVKPDILANPKNYHLFNTMPSVAHTAATLLTADMDAFYSLALNNGSILSIHLDHSTGMVKQKVLKCDVGGALRFLTGITGVFQSRQNRNPDGNTIVSMVLEKFDERVFLFALNRMGYLRVWCCSKLQIVAEMDATGGVTTALNDQCHMIRKAYISGEFVIAIFLSLDADSRLITVTPTFDGESIRFTGETEAIYVAPDEDLVELVADGEDGVWWCLWRSRTTAHHSVIGIDTHHGNIIHSWGREGEAEGGVVENRIGLTPREYYLNCVFSPGVFSAADIAKVLRIYRPNLEADLSKMDLRSKVSLAVESEIDNEVQEYDPSDEVRIEISERCWNRFYVSCLQNQQMGRIPNGLFLIPSAKLLALVTKTNLTLFRETDAVEKIRYMQAGNDQDACFAQLMGVLNKMELGDNHKTIFNSASNGFLPLEDAIAEISEQCGVNNAMRAEMDALCKYPNLDGELGRLMEIFVIGGEVEEEEEATEDASCAKSFHLEGCSDHFRGSLGVKVVATCVKQIVEAKLALLRDLCILLQMVHSTAVKEEFVNYSHDFTASYAILLWCCETQIETHPELISILQSMLGRPEMALAATPLEAAHAALKYLSGKDGANVGQFLLSIKQHVLFLQYVRLIRGNACKDMLVQCHLEMLEPYKAFDVAANHLSHPKEYLNVILTFEEANHWDIAIDLAELALKDIASRDALTSTFLSILFRNHLKLCHYQPAYDCLTKNPNAGAKESGLQELVIALMNANRVDVLLAFPYEGMLPMLRENMQQRARSLHPSEADKYYDFLYALHVKSNDFKKAATVMFERACRSENSETQKRCFAATIDCLSLVNEDSAWLLKPKLSAIEEDEDVLDVYEMKDVKREFELASARVELRNCHADTSPEEILVRLTSSMQFKRALRMARACSLGYEYPLEALAGACLKIQSDPDPWKWLTENDVSDLVMGDSSPLVVAWRLLEALMANYEEASSSSLHKSVANKILSADALLPYWLVSSYKKKNAGELLRLYLKYGELKEGAKLCCEMLVAFGKGKGKEIYALDTTLNISSPAMCLPINSVDLLLCELEANQLDEIHMKVKSALQGYLQSAIALSEDKLYVSR